MRWLDDWMNGRRQAVRSLYRQAERERSSPSGRIVKTLDGILLELQRAHELRQRTLDRIRDMILAEMAQKAEGGAPVDRAPWNQINAGK